LSLATDPGQILGTPDLELLGLAHRACIDLALHRLQAGDVDLPDELPQVIIDDGVMDLPSLRLPPASGACAFCGATTAITEEHVWPKWISRELASQRGFIMASQHGPRPRPTLEVTAPVCDGCNSRWLSVLETDVQGFLRPMIKGGERTLALEEQRLLSTWAVKTALMIDLSGETPLIPTGFYYDIRQRRSALTSNAVWVGAYSGSRWAAWARHGGLHLGISQDEPPNGFVTTFTAFRVVFQVVGHFTRGGAALNDNRLLARALIRIWPPSGGPAAWPPKRLAFDDASLEALANSVR
jgi:hypothetical protein